MDEFFLMLETEPHECGTQIPETFFSSLEAELVLENGTRVTVEHDLQSRLEFVG